MLSRTIHAILFEILIFSLLVLGAGICLLPGYLPFLKWGTNFAVQIMLTYLLLGIIFLVIKKYRLVFLCFGCCAVLSLYLKFSSQTGHKRKLSALFSAQKPPAGKSISLKVALFNTANADREANRTIAILKGAGADLLTMQEVTPPWAALLSDSLKDIYPFRQIMVDMGMQGMAIFSKKEILSVDTFYYQNLPNLVLGIALDEGCEKLFFVSSHMYPVLDQSSYRGFKGHLRTIENHLSKIDDPVIVLGEYNAVSWSNEIQEFRKKTKLQDSRRGFMPSFSDGSVSFTDIPLDHIFFSHHFQCKNFVTLRSKSSNHLGIMGSYQIKIPTNNDSIPLQ